MRRWIAIRLRGPTKLAKSSTLIAGSARDGKISVTDGRLRQLSPRQHVDSESGRLSRRQEYGRSSWLGIKGQPSDRSSVVSFSLCSSSPSSCYSMILPPCTPPTLRLSSPGQPASWQPRSSRAHPTSPSSATTPWLASRRLCRAPRSAQHTCCSSHGCTSTTAACRSRPSMRRVLSGKAQCDLTTCTGR